MSAPACPLCDAAGGRLVFESPLFRAIRADEPRFPAFYRLVWNSHVAEWSDLTPDHRHLMMEAVTVVEQVLREELRPTKINLASLGNQVPHLHWHVIARFDWDSHFPAPVWAEPVRVAPEAQLAALAARSAELDTMIRSRLQTLWAAA